MTSHILRITFIAATTLAFSRTVFAAPPSAVRLRVEQVSKSDTISYKSVQSRSLNITVANSSNEALELKVKYVVFGRDVSTKDVVTVGQGELPVSVKALGTEKVQTPAAQAASEDARIGSKGKSEAMGSKIIGQGVQVLRAEAVVAEYYEPMSVKEHFGKAPVAQPLDKLKQKK
jgi:hypothetical protein